jgi:hypothetical protein
LQYVAVQHDGVLTQRLVVDNRAQAATNEPADFVRTPTDAAAYRLTIGTGTGRPRQHRVFAGHPAEPRALTPARNSFSHAGRDQYPGLAELHQHRALRLTQPSPREPDLPKLIMAASVGSRTHVVSLFQTPMSQAAPGFASDTGPSK